MINTEQIIFPAKCYGCQPVTSAKFKWGKWEGEGEGEGGGIVYRNQKCLQLSDGVTNMTG